MIDQVVLKRIGRRIRAARTQISMTQAELAEKLHVGRERITEYESGKYGIHVSNLPHLAEILNVSILYFFEQDEAENK